VYAPTDDPEGLAAACLGLLQDDEWRRECGERAARLAKEKFIWEHEAAKYVAAFESVIASGRKLAGPVTGLEEANNTTRT
jgi:glycosyltransferase involved in cell wall biosynthesis